MRICNFIYSDTIMHRLKFIVDSLQLKFRHEQGGL